MLVSPMDNLEQNSGKIKSLPPKSVRNAVVLPDGTKSTPLGSGTITSLLGEGGMANVYEIWNAQLEVHRAVKLVHPNCSDEARQRFQTEIKITAKLHHPNIIEIHGVGEWNGLPFIEMEKIQGITLEELINARGALPVFAATAIGIMISRALSFAHNQEYVIYGRKYHGVIHRDLKPSNIMICYDGTVKLMDFGIARPTDASIHTTDGSVLGTLQYLSPEQLDGKELDVRTDVYSLGTTLYEILTGVRAFPERNVSRLMMDKVRNRFRPLEDYAAKFPRRLRHLIHKCMLHDREKRVRTAAVLMSELEKTHKSLTIDTPEQVMRRILSTSKPSKIVLSTHRRFPVWLTVAAVFILVVAGLSTIALYRSFRPGTSNKKLAVADEKSPSPTTAGQENRKIESSSEPSARQAAPKPQHEKAVLVSPTPGSVIAEPQAKAVSIAHIAPLPTPSPPQPPEPKSFIEKTIEKHGTENLVVIMRKKLRAGNFREALRVYDHLPENEKDNTKAVIYKLRALGELKDMENLASFLAEVSIDDGEVHLARAKLAYQRGNYAQARTHLARSLSSPRAFMDYEQLEREVKYYQALCATAEFDATPSESSYKAALDAWYQVRSNLRDDPGHRHNQRALSETQRIGEKFRATKG
ncbi:MAG: protein kinase [Chitinivibrionales bacterium]|nr:protein kinase [Chitinivibrionales bacterium]MBD3355741.1 protein kinase [Chitinivibrionales bacterium]